ncbi:DEAD-box ATP-dependent RNA helicase 21 [Porphyridium purpureum]|uniref:RNA helicase n=1 Tax=Porphyridium purpureum TaxID=35688 RepID=A0A5J4YU00_PORPP|nr:DEAD-box ATP-dependent RNA helicase 21 [Porphyridium purpureum]|eukprot:POR0212..scf227_4
MSGRKAGARRTAFDWDASEDTSALQDAELEALRAQVQDEALRKTRPFDAADLGSNGTDGDLDALLYPRRKHARTQVRHWSDKERAEMTDRDWRIFCEDMAITYQRTWTLKKGEEAVDDKSKDNNNARTALAPATAHTVAASARYARPARNWNEMGLSNELLEIVLSVAKYSRPTPIQMAAIPVVNAGHDLIALAETGSGKTAAFVLPLLNFLPRTEVYSPEVSHDGQNPRALILAPTRELAQQIQAETLKFTAILGHRVVCVVGGQDIDVQAMALREGCDVLIATPGRMVDCLERHMVVLDRCDYLVFDEADRMLDMGFDAQIRAIMQAVCARAGLDRRGERQTLMFSATMPELVRALAKDFMRTSSCVHITIGEAGRSVARIQQRVELIASEPAKLKRLIELLESCDPPVLIFVNTKRGCDMLLRSIEEEQSSRRGASHDGTGGRGAGSRKMCRLRLAVMHSGKTQSTRQELLEKFRRGAVDALIATDVIGRGIDVRGVNHVINYELPSRIDTYVHRIGRTGRAGALGTAWSLATPDDAPLFPLLIHQLRSTHNACPAELLRLCPSPLHPRDDF